MAHRDPRLLDERAAIEVELDAEHPCRIGTRGDRRMSNPSDIIALIADIFDRRGADAYLGEPVQRALSLAEARDLGMTPKHGNRCRLAELIHYSIRVFSIPRVILFRNPTILRSFFGNSSQRSIKITI